ncbi:hypothetical protein CKF54_00695 [Psittacicella hinzii]|uniref:Alpha/beta hydrolase n=1 Tax=Psittacicella hinzii TaxID=2028575 RepID=A0A3A1YB36_9GAMM|nr:DUF452 family protein [Psittacicella hinzii]RIY34410.1 hypothetical protein CKF54_00695 [Psittacicella hinzii]
MLHLRLNTYPLSAEFCQKIKSKENSKEQTPINLVYFHGFTMHDRNYPLVAELTSQGLVALNNSSASEPTSSKLITLSLDFSEQGITLEQACQELEQLLQGPSYFFAFSYGNLVAQLVLANLSPASLNQVKAAHGLNGSLLPYDRNYSILPQVALRTASHWTKESFLLFAANMGMPQEQVELIKARLDKVEESTILAQQQTLTDLAQMYELFQSFLQQESIMQKWQSFRVATDDAIFPVKNLQRFAQDFNLKITVLAGKHYLAPQEVINQFCNPTYYA